MLGLLATCKFLMVKNLAFKFQKALPSPCDSFGPILQKGRNYVSQMFIGNIHFEQNQKMKIGHFRRQMNH
jgi:hypothetical protein